MGANWGLAQNRFGAVCGLALDMDSKHADRIVTVVLQGAATVSSAAMGR